MVKSGPIGAFRDQITPESGPIGAKIRTLLTIGTITAAKTPQKKGDSL